jgi:hypothetical protein
MRQCSGPSDGQLLVARGRCQLGDELFASAFREGETVDGGARFVLIKGVGRIPVAVVADDGDGFVLAEDSPGRVARLIDLDMAVSKKSLQLGSKLIDRLAWLHLNDFVNPVAYEREPEIPQKPLVTSVIEDPAPRPVHREQECRSTTVTACASALPPGFVAPMQIG